MKYIYIVLLVVISYNISYANTDIAKDLNITQQEYIFPSIKSSDIIIKDNNMTFNISNKIDVINSNITIRYIK